MFLTQKKDLVKIVDFGLAKKYSKGEMLKTFAGSPFNMAPQIMKGHSYDQKVDVYSLGTVLYQMLFGVCPFKGKDHQQLLKEIQSGKFRKQQTVVISQKVQLLLKGMLQSQPENRMDLSHVMDAIKHYESKLKD